MNEQFDPLLYTISVWALPAIIAITFHEAAHGFAARLLGDDTAWRLGRVTFNPLKHIDPIGTILLPGLLLFLHSPFLFGYAKPVPVNFRALRNPRRGTNHGHQEHRRPSACCQPARLAETQRRMPYCGTGPTQRTTAWSTTSAAPSSVEIRAHGYLARSVPRQ
jgi:hypothetical protein